MKCFYCKSEMSKDFTTHVVELKNCIVIIKNVPCMKCTQCNETVISGSTLKKIDELLDKCENLTEVAIINYNNLAA